MIKQLATRQIQTRSVDLEIRGLKNTPHQLQKIQGEYKKEHVVIITQVKIIAAKANFI